MLRSRAQLLVLAASSAVSTTAALAQSGFYTEIPSLAGGTPNRSNAAAISADGLTIVGASDSANSFSGNLEDAYRLTIDSFGFITSGPVSLGALAAGNNYISDARGVSGDGSVVAGFSRAEISGNNRTHATRFLPSPILDIHTPTQTLGTSFGYAVSANGVYVVGGSTTTTSVTLRPFRWSAAGGVEVLPVLTGSGASSARAVSSDGSVIVGDSASKPFVWTSAGGTVAIPALSGAADNFGEALGVSADGLVAVGAITSGDPAFGYEAFRFAGGVNRGLGALPSSSSRNSEARAVSASGLVIVGESQTGGDLFNPIFEAFVWTPRWGMVKLADRVVDAGGSPLVPSGILLNEAVSISADGTVIVGNASEAAASRTFGYAVKIKRYCVGDHNDDGTLTPQDIFDFLNDWFGSQARADADASGVLTPQDIFDFLNAWFSGC